MSDGFLNADFMDAIQYGVLLTWTLLLLCRTRDDDVNKTCDVCYSELPPGYEFAPELCGCSTVCMQCFERHVRVLVRVTVWINADVGAVVRYLLLCDRRCSVQLADVSQTFPYPCALCRGPLTDTDMQNLCDTEMHGLYMR